MNTRKMTGNTDSSYLYLDSDQQLVEFCQLIEPANYIAIDTEFVREKTYYPELSLIQVATEQHQACIDPQCINDFSPFVALLVNPEIIKVLHSPSQDMELFYQQFNCHTVSVFDTQLAAALLGYASQIGYADLVKQLTGTQLDKAYTRTNWNKRPLSAAELDYAMDDVIYLLPVYLSLQKALVEKHRFDWMTAEFDRYADPALFQPDLNQLWKKLKGVQKISGFSLQIAQLLCVWRESLAQKKNLPKRWVIQDDVIIEISRIKPNSISGFEHFRQIKPGFIKQYGNEILSVLETASNIPEPEWPRHSKMQKLNTNQQALGDCLMALCRLFAGQHQIAIASLVTRKDIDQLILDRKNCKLASGWRLQLVGQHLIDFIGGKNSLNVIDGQIVFHGE